MAAQIAVSQACVNAQLTSGSPTGVYLDAAAESATPNTGGASKTPKSSGRKGPPKESTQSKLPELVWSPGKGYPAIYGDMAAMAIGDDKDGSFLRPLHAAGSEPGTLACPTNRPAR